MKKAMFVAVLGGALFLAACGGGEETGGDTDTGSGAGATLTMVDNAFEPADATFATGEEIELVNDGQAIHNLTVEGAEIDQDVEAGQSASVALDLEPGEYTMFCEYHRGAGMEGTLTVE